MHQLLSQRRHISLIVCLAIVLNLVWPGLGLGQTMAAPGVALLAAEICSANGTPYSTPAQSGGEPQLPVIGRHVKHCALCASLAGAPPPMPCALRVFLATSAAPPAPGYCVPTPRPDWPDAHPRAPPSLA